jgi:hypothetical protein
MMGRLNHDQRQLFYSFRLEDAVPDDHLVRAIAGERVQASRFSDLTDDSTADPFWRCRSLRLVLPAYDFFDRAIAR